MNTRQFKETFLQYARTGIRPTIYKNQVSKFVREYHHITQTEFLEFRKEFAYMCDHDRTINHWHQYLPVNFENDFFNLIEEIKKADVEIKFENVLIEGLFIVDKFLNKYIEMFRNSSATVRSIRASEQAREHSVIASAAQHYTDFSKTVNENFDLIKKKYLSHYGSEYDSFLRQRIVDLFLFKKLNTLPQEEKEDLIKNGALENLPVWQHKIIMGE